MMRLKQLFTIGAGLLAARLPREMRLGWEWYDTNGVFRFKKDQHLHFQGEQHSFSARALDLAVQPFLFAASLPSMLTHGSEGFRPCRGKWRSLRLIDNEKYDLSPDHNDKDPTPFEEAWFRVIAVGKNKDGADYYCLKPIDPGRCASDVLFRSKFNVETYARRAALPKYFG